ncbi:MAG: helix-turn-helix domain-containing protein [Burkholderiales bacterium]|nr:helix-turn-helix domain-containing protein [Burkholderiales bacterium]
MTSPPIDRRHPQADRRRRGRRASDQRTLLARLPHSRSLGQLKAACSQCSLQELCLPAGVDMLDLARIDQLTQKRQRILRHQALYKAGDPFHSIYAVRAGFFKTEGGIGDGRDQITGFQMAGELIGLDGISSGRHACSAVALEDSEVCIIPFSEMETLARAVPALQRSLHRLMSREMVQDHRLLALLGTGTAEQRITAFLADLSARLALRGYAASEFVLRMTREEIGRHLGLTLETVSRTLSRLQRRGTIRVQQRLVRIIDPEALAGRVPV